MVEAYYSKKGKKNKEINTRINKAFKSYTRVYYIVYNLYLYIKRVRSGEKM